MQLGNPDPEIASGPVQFRFPENIKQSFVIKAFNAGVLSLDVHFSRGSAKRSRGGVMYLLENVSKII